jgi:hypothetical protein
MHVSSSICACCVFSSSVRGVVCALNVLSGVEPQFLAREGSIVAMKKDNDGIFLQIPLTNSRSSDQEKQNPLKHPN